MRSEPGPIVGIDLGTTFSGIGYLDGDQVRLIENGQGDVLTPSVVAYDRRSEAIIVGRAARDILATSPKRAAARFKRDMGGPRTFELAGRVFTPVELSACVVDSLRRDAELVLGCAVDRCVITVPAYFSEAQRHATKRAAELAGFTVERVLNEPTAAAIAYGMHHRDDESTFIVVDLGGGTFDVSIMELFEGMLQVKSVAGESLLGGEDFTDRLVELAMSRAGIDPARARSVDPDAYALLFKRAELLKRKLARWPAAPIDVPAFEGVRETATTVEIAAEHADEAYAPLLARLVGPCRSALRGGGVRLDELSDVLLVGGATRMPCIRRFAAELFGREPNTQDDPDIAVARGAAIQAALCAHDTAVGDIVVTDVLSHSLGVDVAREVGSQHVPGYFSPVIHRNTVIPTSRTELYQTIADNQRAMEFTIYEGESRRVADNRALGELKVRGIPKGFAGQHIVEVTFTYDLDGMLEVEARIAGTDRAVSQIFEREGKALSPDELERARARIAELRADPKQDPKYSEILARADLLWKEMPPDERHAVGQAIDELEHALQTRTPKLIDAAYRALLTLCDALDCGERW